MGWTRQPGQAQGQEISIWTQVVSLADVYDALVSEPVYKAAYPHDQAVHIILDGECGEFNPDILKYFERMTEPI